ncbi:AraC family transcriptional regulator [Paenibacillus ginsengarvi]|uniref:AraC family transcriptional regulator n=2 Tax=Paenibacillus ginsengarvi TaxID=400777 RepID=A0A3B0C502_9BACL|nr:AraC family transcriptional regulator [Paenibacillus ginsengarvi]
MATLTFTGTTELKLANGGVTEMTGRDEQMFGFVGKGNAKAVVRSDEAAGRSGKLMSGELFYLPPDCSCTLENEGSGVFHIRWIRFRCDGGDMPELAGSLCESADFAALRFRLPQARGWMAGFPAEDPEELEPAAFFRLQAHLYAIASAYVGHHRKPKGTDDDLLDYVEQTKRYMTDRYAEPIDVEELARQSGASSGRFYEAFRKQTGLSPHKYMTFVRLGQALGMLADLRSSVSEVAHSAGYPDELYFSRLFKKHMGMSPTEYAACAHKKIVMQPIFEGDLSVLGIRPEWMLDRGWWEHPEPFVRQIAETRPELVLTSPIPGELLRAVAEISPIISLEWKGYPWKKRLTQISGILGIGSVAEWWLAFYDRKVDNARRLVRRHLGNTPFLLASAHGPGYRIYGMQMNKVKDLFYDDLGVKPPEEAFRFGLLEVDSFREVADMPSDNLILLMPHSRSEEDISDCRRRWSEREGRPEHARCLVVRYAGPLMYNAAANESLIDQTVRLLAAK